MRDLGGALTTLGHMPAALPSFLVVALVHLGAQAMTPDGWIAGITQVLLMPALAWVLHVSTPDPPSRLVRLVLVGLGLCWIGDTIPRFFPDGTDLDLALMLGAFVLAQLVYVAAFAPFVGRSIIRTRPKLLIPYLFVFLAVLGLTAGGTGGFLVGVIVYGAVITAMAVLATGLDRIAGIGGALFMVSDALIAVRAFGGLAVPHHELWVMLTYVLAQAMIVMAVANEDRADVADEDLPVAARQA